MSKSDPRYHNPVNDRHKFNAHYSGHLLANLLRSIADEIDIDGMRWTHYHLALELKEGDPVKGSDGKLWKTFDYTKTGALQIAWSLDASGDITAEPREVAET